MAFETLTVAPMKSPHLFDTLPLASIALHPFADRCYLQQVINHLAAVRREKRLGLRELARRAGLKMTTVSRAEREGMVPATRDFRAWAQALGLSWEQVWTFSLPESQPVNRCEMTPSSDGDEHPYFLGNQGALSAERRAGMWN